MNMHLLLEDGTKVIDVNIY